MNIHLQWVIVGSTILGVLGGLVGAVLYVRRESLTGDVISHATLPGITSYFLLTHERNPLGILTGGIIAAALSYFCVQIIKKYTPLKEDGALAVTLTLFFPLGTFQLVEIQNLPVGGKSGLDRFLFGQIAALTGEEVKVLWLLLAIIGLFFFSSYRKLGLWCFDKNFYDAQFPRSKVPFLFLLSSFAVAVGGTYLAGVVLLSSLYITPAASARLLAQSFGGLLCWSASIGVISSVTGVLLSWWYPSTPTGPWVVLSAAAYFGVISIVAPSQGLIAQWYRRRKVKVRIESENVLRILEKLGAHARTVPLQEIVLQKEGRVKEVERLLITLLGQGLIRREEKGYLLTEQGAEAGVLLTRRHRLWESYLVSHVGIAPDHAHEDAEAVEHFLTGALEEELSRSLKNPDQDPHGREIPPSPRKEKK